MSPFLVPVRSSVQRISAAASRLALFIAALLVLFSGLSLHAQTSSSTVTASLGPAAPYYTDDVTATVSVTPTSSPVPSGFITWNTDSGGQQTASLVNGVARIELKFFAPGAHAFHYAYSGDSTYAPVASQSLAFTVADRAFSIIGSEYKYFSNAISNGTSFTAALDSKNNIYLPAPATNSLAKLDPLGNISTVAVTGLSRPNGIVIDSSDNIYLADSGNARIVEISASGTQSVVPITGLIDPLSLAFDPAKQNLYITDQGNNNITVYNLAAQTQTTFATGELLYGIAVDATGNVYYSGATSAFSGDGKVYRRDPSGNTITIFTGLDNPQGLLVGPQGELYIEAGGLFVLDAQSHLSQLTFVAAQSRPVQGYILPGNLAMDRRGNIYRPSANDIFVPGKSVAAGPAVYDPSFGHSFYVYYQVSYQETITSVTTVSGSPAVNGSNYVPTPAPSPASVPFIYFDELFTVIGYAGPWSSYLTVTTSDGKQDTPIVYGTGQAASFAVAPGTITPQSLTVSSIGGVIADPTGVVYISDPASNQVVKLPPGATTTASVPFTGLNQPTQLALDGAGAVYVLDSGTSRILKVDAAGNQSVAFDVSTQTALTSLTAFAMDGATNLYLAGPASAGGSAIYYLDTLGNQVLVAGNVEPPVTLAVDFNGYVYSAGISGDLTRYDPAGNPTQLDIGLDRASALAVDASGTIYVAGAANNEGVTVVSPDGTEAAYPTDGLPADSLTSASAVAIVPDGSGNLVLGDKSGKQIFRIQRGQSFGQLTNAAGDNFGNVPLGSSRPIDGFLTNVGNVATASFGLQQSIDDFSFATGSQECVTSNDGSALNPPLAPAGICELSLTFSPTYLGAHTAGFNFYDPSTLGIYLSLTASGNAVAATGPAPVLTPATMNFGNVPINTVSANQTATLTNTGTASLYFDGFSVSGTNLGGFGYSGSTCGNSLAAGASCTVQINCDPAGVVETLTASFNANFPSPIAQQSIALTCNAVATSTAPQAALTPATANFGSVTVGTASAAQTFTLTNAGSASLPVTSVTITGTNASVFAIGTNGCGPTLAAGASCTIAVTFSPTAAGSAAAALSVVDSVGTQTSSLAGTGAAAVAAAPQAALTPATASFGSVNVGSASSAQTFTLTNAGNASLPITSATITGTNASIFTLGANNCGATLGAGASCTITITFNPTAAGGASASLSIVDSVGTQTSSLTGTGIAIATPDFGIAATPPAQSITAGASANYTVNITPTGGFASAVTLTAAGLPPGATANFTPASVTPGEGAASSTMTIQTASTQTASSNPRPAWRYGFPVLATIFIMLPFRRLRRWRGMLCALLFSTTLFVLSGCGGGFGLAKPTSATPYTITVTGTSGALTHSTTVQITIQVAGE